MVTTPAKPNNGLAGVLGPTDGRDVDEDVVWDDGASDGPDVALGLADTSDVGEGDRLTTGDEVEVGADDGLSVGDPPGFGARIVRFWDCVDALGCTSLDGTF